MNKRVINNLTELSSDNGYIHKIGTDTYFKRGFIVDDISNYEEVDKQPNYTREEYVEKVRELIKLRYSIEDELAIHRQKDLKPEEYKEYNTYCERCKNEAKEVLNNIDKFNNEIIS